MNKKQPIQSESKNAPTGTPLAGRSATPQLNSDQSCSVAGEVTGLYLPEEDQQDGRPVSDCKVPKANVRVFVLDANNTPLMPCSPRKARKLLKEKKAIVIKVRPCFTIKLTQHCGGTTQPVDLNIDTGYEYIGFVLVGVYCYLLGQMQLDNKMSKRLADRAMYRRNRRNRLRYRPARWKNRKKKDLSPSVQKRIDRHIKLIEWLSDICPITKLNIEGAYFDIQKLMNPDITPEGYQEGVLFRSNLRAYLFARENGICQCCGKEIKPGQRVEMHHIIHRSKGGTNKPDNYALLHDTCHNKMHETNDFSKLKPNEQYKAQTFMNILRKRLFERFPEAIECFGYETKAKREALGLPKEHYYDAYALSGRSQILSSLPLPVNLVEKHRNNRSLQVQKKGKPIAVRRKRYPIQPNDIFWVGKKKYVSAGSLNLGKRVWIKENGISTKKSIATAKITRCYHFGTVAVES